MCHVVIENFLFSAQLQTFKKTFNHSPSDTMSTIKIIIDSTEFKKIKEEEKGKEEDDEVMMMMTTMIMIMMTKTMMIIMTKQ